MPKRVDHNERRREIIEALMRITVRGGLSAASFREVAAEAGVSVRLVQYYFGTKADLMHAANRYVLQRMGARIAQRVASLGADAPPRDIVLAVVNTFLPNDDESREAMLLFYAFYTAQMTDPTLARKEARDVPQDLAALIARQIRRAQATGDAPTDIDPDLEGAVLTAALPSIASSPLVGYHSAAAAAKVVEYMVDRILPAPAPARRKRVTARKSRT